MLFESFMSLFVLTNPWSCLLTNRYFQCRFVCSTLVFFTYKLDCSSLFSASLVFLHSNLDIHNFVFASSFVWESFASTCNSFRKHFISWASARPFCNFGCRLKGLYVCTPCFPWSPSPATVKANVNTICVNACWEAWRSLDTIIVFCCRCTVL